MKFRNSKKSSSPDRDEIEDPYEHMATYKWYERVPEDPAAFESVSEQVLVELKEEAKNVHDAESESYVAKSGSKSSKYQWMKTIMAKGTVSDKIAAFTVIIQENPVCNLEALRNLVGMVKVSKKKECVTVIETLTELFLSDLLIPHRKLKPFHQRPLSLLNEISSANTVTRKKLLSLWYFEDQLKEIYTTYILSLNAVAHDTVENNKEKAISAMYKLLAGNPEQEKNLLAYIVNKLGDPSQKVASKAIYCLSQLLYKHPNMQRVVLAETEKLLFRVNVSTKAQYYSLCFLSQFYLNHEEPEVARKLIEVYFAFFKACIRKGEVDSRMMSALLMGVNRAYPYAKLESDKIAEHIDTMYRVVHLASFNVSLHALSLLYQVSDFANDVNDRFYCALYKKLFDPRIITTTHHAILLNLVYKALLKDTETKRVRVFVKRLLQIALYTEPSFSCGILYLVSQLITKNPTVQALLLKPPTVPVLNELEDDDEEKYTDAVLEEESTDNTNTVQAQSDEAKPDSESENKAGSVSQGWFHRTTSQNKNLRIETQYDPLKRNPLYAGGDLCAYQELLQLKNHFHPSVALFAENILKNEGIKYAGDPLKDFTLIRFLDRFVFKNPKKLEDPSKLGAHPTFGKRKLYKPLGVKSLPVVSNNYLKEEAKNIPADELFLYTYLQKRYKDKEVKDEDDESDVESVASEEFEELLSKMSGLPKDDEDVDFMNDIGGKLKENKEADVNDMESDDGNDATEEFDDDVGDDEELTDEDNSDADFEDEFEDEDDEMNNSDISSEQEQSKKNGKKKKANTSGSLFASAEEFASILEDEGSSKAKPGSSHAVSNKDNANVKQIEWEEKRNRWLQGYNKALGKKEGNFKSRGNKGKRPTDAKKFSKAKKQRRF